jgi:hypothetical protein
LQHSDPLAELLRFAQVVCAKKDRLALVAAQMQDQIMELAGDNGVEPSRGFIQEDHVGLVDQGTR